MRRTTPEEIEKLYQFTRIHYVEYYDVQTELVDHLASAMDENWEKEPELSYDENLQREFKKFGIFGFTEVVEKKSQAMGKRYFRLIGKEMKLQLLDPRVLFSLIVIFFGILMLLKHGSFALSASVLAIYFGVVWYFIFKTSRELKRKKRAGERIYLLEAAILNTVGYFSFTYLPFQIFSYLDFAYSELWFHLFTALVFTFLVFSCYVCLFVMPRKRDEILLKQYPELKI